MSCFGGPSLPELLLENYFFREVVLLERNFERERVLILNRSESRVSIHLPVNFMLARVSRNLCILWLDQGCTQNVPDGRLKKTYIVFLSGTHLTQLGFTCTDRHWPPALRTHSSSTPVMSSLS